MKILDFRQNNGDVGARIFIEKFLVEKIHIADKLCRIKAKFTKRGLKMETTSAKLTKLRKCEGSAIDNELAVKSLPINIIKSFKLSFH